MVWFDDVVFVDGCYMEVKLLNIMYVFCGRCFGIGVLWLLMFVVGL